MFNFSDKLFKIILLFLLRKYYEIGFRVFLKTLEMITASLNIRYNNKIYFR